MSTLQHRTAPHRTATAAARQAARIPARGRARSTAARSPAAGAFPAPYYWYYCITVLYCIDMSRRIFAGAERDKAGRTQHAARSRLRTAIDHTVLPSPPSPPELLGVTWLALQESLVRLLSRMSLLLPRAPAFAAETGQGAKGPSEIQSPNFPLCRLAGQARNPTRPSLFQPSRLSIRKRSGHRSHQPLFCSTS